MQKIGCLDQKLSRKQEKSKFSPFEGPKSTTLFTKCSVTPQILLPHQTPVTAHHHPTMNEKSSATHTVQYTHSRTHSL